MVKKTCTKCKEEKELNEFPVDRKNKLGLAAECKVCNRLRVKAYQSTLSDEQRREQARAARYKNYYAYKEKSALQNRARNLAVKALVDAHRKEYEKLLDKARESLGMSKARRLQAGYKRPATEED